MLIVYVWNFRDFIHPEISWTFGIYIYIYTYVGIWLFAAHVALWTESNRNQ